MNPKRWIQRVWEWQHEPTYAKQMYCPQCGVEVIYNIGDPMAGFEVYCKSCEVELIEGDNR